MPAIKGIDKKQMLLFCLDSMAAPNSSAGLIDAFVDALECTKAGTGEPAKTCRPPYDRMALIKLCLYGYVNDIRSSRQLARECLVNVEAKWLIDGTAPDFSTIDSFAKDYADLLRDVFYEFNLRVSGEVQWSFEPAASNLLSGMTEEDIAAKAVEAKEMIAFYEGVYEDCPKKLKKH